MCLVLSRLKAAHQGFPCSVRRSAAHKRPVALALCQVFQHQTHHAEREIQAPLMAGKQECVVFAHPAVPADSSDRPFNNPAAWEELERWAACSWLLVCPHPTAAPVEPLDSRQAPVERLPHARLQRTQRGVIHPDPICSRRGTVGWSRCSSCRDLLARPWSAPLPRSLAD